MVTRRAASLALLAALALYGLYEALPLVRGPQLEVTAPAPNVESPDGLIRISGRVRHVAVLTVNGAPLLYDQEGRFSSTLLFPRGGSILTIMAADRFGRTRTETRTIFVP